MFIKRKFADSCMIVMKFGGSSVQDAHMMQQAAQLIVQRLAQKLVVVLSAMKGTTDALLKSMQEALQGTFTSYAWIEQLHKKTLQELALDPHLLDKELHELHQAL